MYTLLSKFAVFPPKKQVVNIKRLRLTLTVMDIKTTLAQDNLNSTCPLHVIHPQLLKPNIYFCIYIFGLQK